MLREIRPDVVIISTRLDQITPIAIEAANAGCHLICEKPLALTQTGLMQLYETCRNTRRHCIAMLGNGRQPAMQAAAGVIRDGQIGDVVLLNARKSYKWGNRPEWFGQPEHYGNTISWVGIHGLDMIDHLSGQGVLSVAAMQSNRVRTDRPACQDNGVILLRLSGGGHASVSFDYLRPAAAVTHGDDWVRVVGSRGVVETNLDRNTCRLITNDMPEHDVPLPPRAPYYATFLDQLNQGTYPPLEMRRAFGLTHLSLVAADAAGKNTVEPVPQMPWHAGV
jgi:predicted dehydrogenase